MLRTIYFIGAVNHKLIYSFILYFVSSFDELRFGLDN